ncbi:sugar kinase [Candidatus Bathyarchaeota archaeon]|nr:sugar kinase [Candidatus Bathyarchaeota archaeon]
MQFRMKLDLVGLGSAIVDFVPNKTGVSLSEVCSFSPSAGGAVANVVVAASRLGLTTAFVGCVGDDEFGAFILRDFKKEGVDVSYLKKVKGRNTGVAFYSVDKCGERHYVFYRFPGYSDPESELALEDADIEYITCAKVLHVSEAMFRQDRTRETTLKVLSSAKEKGVMVSYDPNMRKTLWSSQERFSETQRKIIGLTDIFLSTLKEASLIVGEQGGREIAERTLALGPSIVVLREERCYQVRTVNQRLTVPISKVKAVDTSGAGDAFDAGFLTGVIKGMSLKKAVLLGNAVASLKVMKVGTRTGLPRMNEALAYIRSKGRSVRGILEVSSL